MSEATAAKRAQGLPGEVHKIWSTADDEPVCTYCGCLEGMEIDVDDKFCVTNGKRTLWTLYPPAHPSCRCAFMDKEVVPPVRQMGYQDGYDSKGQKNTFLNGSKSGLNGGKDDDIISCMEITNEWIKEHNKKGSVTEKKSYIVSGIAHIVDGVHVILKPSDQERKVADILGRKYGKTVELVPQIVYPQGIQTPDYLIDGERFDLKSPTGSGKNLIYGLIAKKRKQAGNFIIDISKCPLSKEEIARQIENLYTSPRLGFLEKVVLIKDGEVLKVYSRK